MMVSDGISATSSVANSYVTDNRAQSATAGSVPPASALGSVGAGQAVEASGKAERSRADNDNRTPQLTEQQQAEQLEEAVNKINEMMREGGRSLSFSVDKDIKQVVVTVTNTETDEVVRQIPNVEALKFSRELEGMMGLIFNDKA